MNDIFRKAGTEFLATLLFVFAIVSAVTTAGAFAPIAIGFALMILVYSTGHISGGHVNPAVSLGAFLRGAMTATEMVIYCCLLYTSPSPRDRQKSRMPSSA